jgi:hypothetical protein
MRIRRPFKECPVPDVNVCLRDSHGRRRMPTTDENTGTGADTMVSRKAAILAVQVIGPLSWLPADMPRETAQLASPC